LVLLAMFGGIMVITEIIFADIEVTWVKYLFGPIIIMVAMHLFFRISRYIVNARRLMLREIRKFKKNKLSAKEVLGRYYDYEEGDF